MRRAIQRLEGGGGIIFVDGVQRILGIVLIDGIERIVRVVPVDRIRRVAGIDLIDRVERIVRIDGVDGIQRIVRTVLIDRIEDIVVALVLRIEPLFGARRGGGEEQRQEKKEHNPHGEPSHSTFSIQSEQPTPRMGTTASSGEKSPPRSGPLHPAPISKPCFEDQPG